MACFDGRQDAHAELRQLCVSLPDCSLSAMIRRLLAA
jgi:hypothetical protein